MVAVGPSAEVGVGAMPDSAQVCSCNNVGEGNLTQMIRGGCSDFRQLCQQSGAGMGCGSCKPEVKALLDRSLELEPVAV